MTLMQYRSTPFMDGRFMSEPKDHSIGIPILRSVDPVTRSSARSKRQNWGYGLIFTTIAIGTIGGFGAMHFYGGNVGSEQLDPIEEVDGFELATPFVAVPSPDNSPSDEVSSELPLNAPHVVDDSIASRHSIKSITTSTPKVWLTGTIEDESAEPIELPSRISGGPSDSNTFR